MSKSELATLLVLEMKRCIQLIEANPDMSPTKPETYGTNTYQVLNKDMSELRFKLAEVRRDSVRLMKEVYKP